MADDDFGDPRPPLRVYREGYRQLQANRDRAAARLVEILTAAAALGVDPR